MNSETRRTGGSRRLPEPAPALVRYFRVREDGSETEGCIGLDRNERLEPLPDWFMDRVRGSLSSDMLTSYPMQDRLHAQLADSLGISTEQLLLTPGSDAGIKSLYQAYVRPNDRVVMLDPSYAMFPVYADMYEAEAVRVPFDYDLNVDSESLLGSIAAGVRLVLIANPNQPTGTLLDVNVLHEMIEKAGEVGAIAAIDEAYYPFSEFTVLPLLDRHPNLVMLRTFSKASGLAGLRLGFVAGHAEVIGNLFKVRAANDINSFAISCASQLLSHPEIIEDYGVQVQEGAKVLAEKTRALGLTPLPTRTNFMLVRVGHRCPPGELVERLREHGYIVKGQFSSRGMEDCIRMTIGSPRLMAAFADVLEAALAETTAPEV